LCFFCAEFILILLICLSLTSTKRLAAILKILILLYSPVQYIERIIHGYYNTFLVLNMISHSFAALTREISSLLSVLEISIKH
jgi:hypothetical protein